jgi:hypothetical protein
MDLMYIFTLLKPAEVLSLENFANTGKPESSPFIKFGAICRIGALPRIPNNKL